MSEMLLPGNQSKVSVRQIITRLEFYPDIIYGIMRDEKHEIVTRSF